MIRQAEKIILIADDEASIAETMSLYLSKKGFKTHCATDGAQALKLFHEHQPNVVITDVRMPVMDGVRFLMEVRKFDTQTPFILTTAHPELNSAIDAIHLGAFDYILKPFQLEGLHQKVRQALTASRLEKENVILSRLASLHEVTGKLSATHDLQTLIDVTLQSCLDVLHADGCSIMLVDAKKKTLNVVRQRGAGLHSGHSEIDTDHEWPMAKWVFKNGQSLLITNGRTFPEVAVPFDVSLDESAIFVPLKVAEEVIGLITLHRANDNPPFTIVDLNTIDVLASQAGIALNNANLYASVNQKLDELSLISTYAEQLMGLVDRKEVVECLFKTVQRHFPIDMIGFLLPQKRFHKFLYWSRGEMPEEYLNTICESVIENHNETCEQKIQRRRVSLQRTFIESKETYIITRTPFAFAHFIPLQWEEFSFGAVFFGASRELENQDEKVYLLSSLVNQTRIGLTNAKLYSDMKENYIRTIKALAIAVDAKDTYTHGHSENVMNIAEAIAEEMKMDPKWVGIIRDAGLLHDIGKIGIPGYILNKPGPLTAEEFNGIMKTHCTLGANIVKDVPFLQYLYSLILYHHENYDGTGYPEGLKKDATPLGARILHVADAFEAMTSNRPYRDSLGKKEALRRLEEECGKQFDPEVVQAFIRVARKKGWFQDPEP
jgi:putative nucleotidyltransferase with HDIG domain